MRTDCDRRARKRHRRRNAASGTSFRATDKAECTSTTPARRTTAFSAILSHQANGTMHRATAWMASPSSTRPGTSSAARRQAGEHHLAIMSVASDSWRGSVSKSRRGNFIGTDATGSAPLANRFNGVGITSASYNLIGERPLARNVIAGNRLSGITIESNSLANAISGNFIGWTPPAPMPAQFVERISCCWERTMSLGARRRRGQCHFRQHQNGVLLAGGTGTRVQAT